MICEFRDKIDFDGPVKKVKIECNKKNAEVIVIITYDSGELTQLTINPKTGIIIME